MKVPAALLSPLAVLALAACSSSDGARPDVTMTSTFMPPPALPSPGTTPIPTSTAPASKTITLDNASMLKPVSSVMLDAPFNSLTWRGDGQAVFVTTRQGVFALRSGEAGLVSVLNVAEPAFVLDTSSQGVAAVAEDLHTISLRETGPNTVLRTLTLPETMTAAHFSPDGKILAVTIAEQIAVQLWDVETGKKVDDITGFETAAPVYSAHFGPAGRTLIWQSRARAQVVDLVVDEPGPAITEADFISALAMSPAEKVLATTAGARLTLWDLETGDILDVSDLPGLATALCYTPDGRLLFVGSQSGIIILHLPLLTPAGTLQGEMQAITVSPDGDGLATVSRDGTLTIYRP